MKRSLVRGWKGATRGFGLRITSPASGDQEAGERKRPRVVICEVDPLVRSTLLLYILTTLPGALEGFVLFFFKLQRFGLQAFS